MNFGIDIVTIHPSGSAEFPGEIHAVRLVAARIIFLEAISVIYMELICPTTAIKVPQNPIDSSGCHRYSVDFRGIGNLQRRMSVYFGVRLTYFPAARV
jgi:hypothetical protein